MINSFTTKNFGDLPDLDKINILAQERNLPDDQFMAAISDFEIGSKEEVIKLANILESHRPELAKRLCA